jgi:four helix bundle protein
VNASAPVPAPETKTPKVFFSHDRLDVYQTALQFVILADDTAAAMARGRSYLADQLRRASTSITLNIAEGAGEFSPRDKSRFYRIARRSAAECAAILDLCNHLNLTEERIMEDGRELLHRIVAMLTRLAQIDMRRTRIR